MSDPFEVLGVEPRFDLDEAELHRRFIAASAATHPDRFTDPLDQADAADRAAAINDAYRTLKEPESRARALLVRLRGAAGGASDDKALPPELLGEMLEVRERQEEAEAAGDQVTLAELRRWAEEQRREHLERVGELFRAVAAGAGNDDVFLSIRRALNAIRYFARMLEALPAV